MDTTNIGRDMQVAPVALEIAHARCWQLLGLRSTLLIGHSLSDYAALCVVLSVGEVLAQAYERAKLIFTRGSPSVADTLAVGPLANIVQWRIRDSSAFA